MAGRELGLGGGTGRETTREPHRDPKTLVQTVATREAASYAEREIRFGDSELDIVDADLGWDDAPGAEETWEFVDLGEVDPLVGVDPEAELPDYEPGWAVRPSISIWPVGNSFDVTIDLPFNQSPEVEMSLAFRRERLEAIATILTGVQAEALRARSRVEAYRALNKLNSGAVSKNWATGQDAAGQTSRDRLTVIDTQFGQVPLWFFLHKSKGAVADLLWAANRMSRGEAVTTAPIAEAAAMEGHILTTSADQLARHTKSISTAQNRPDVVRRYRALWPNFAPEDYLDDLGLAAGGRSDPAAILVLIGAIPAQSPPKELR